jgi:hypothetical protein
MKLSTAVGDDGGGIDSGPLNRTACSPTMMNSRGDRDNNNILHFISYNKLQ